jgi:hypothetical protein
MAASYDREMQVPDPNPPPYVSMLIRQEQHYILTYEKTQGKLACRALGNWASNPGLDFSWYDAARMAQEVREHCRKK